jgi:plastocyanin
VQIPAHKSGSTVLKKVGTVEYFCRVHPNMTGRIVVEPR